MKVSLINWHVTPKQTPLGHVPCRGLDAAYEGLKNIGVDVMRIPYYSTHSERNVICWGYKPKIVERFRRFRKNCLVLELGYIGDRTKNISLGWNGLNNYAEFPDILPDGGERFYKHGGKLKPWKKGGDYILILGQVKNDASMRGKDIMPWYIECARRASDIYKIPVYFRPHPESIRRGGYSHIQGISNIDGTLDDVVGGALFTIAWNSNSCLDSIMAGTPCYAGDRGTMAYDLCMQDMSVISKPDREDIVYSIAQKQWTLEELKSGQPFIKALEMKGVFNGNNI